MKLVYQNPFKNEINLNNIYKYLYSLKYYKMSSTFQVFMAAVFQTVVILRVFSRCNKLCLFFVSIFRMIWMLSRRCGRNKSFLCVCVCVCVCMCVCTHIHTYIHNRHHRIQLYEYTYYEERSSTFLRNFVTNKAH